MTKLPQLDINSLTRSVIGFDRLFHEAERRLGSSSYPPHNIISVDKDTYEIEFAVAGFKRSELDLRFENGQLTISGKHSAPRDVEYLYQGLAHRNFVKTVGLTDYIEVVGAELEDGILRVKLERVLPDALKPKIINID